MILQNNKFILLSLCSAALLGACQKAHENPLLSKKPHEVLAWLHDNSSTQIEACAKHWADPKTAPTSSLALCEDIAISLAEEMNYQGFSQNVLADDLGLPLIWRKFHARIKDLKIFKEKVKKAQERTRNNPLFNKLNQLK